MSEDCNENLNASPDNSDNQDSLTASNDEKEVKPENNPYAYLDRDEFSSERFKIAVKNLPKFYGVNVRNCALTWNIVMC